MAFFVFDSIFRIRRREISAQAILGLRKSHLNSKSSSEDDNTTSGVGATKPKKLLKVSNEDKLQIQ